MNEPVKGGVDPWVCPRCFRVNAPHLPHCDCQPDPDLLKGEHPWSYVRTIMVRAADILSLRPDEMSPDYRKSILGDINRWLSEHV